jgi:hypothetical protein
VSADIKHSGKAVIEDGSIVIRVAIEALPTIIEGVGALWNSEGNPGFKITNVEEFAADLVRALNNEEEDGTTPIHTMVDAAIFDAIEQGALGVEET